jgi:hypothetical protein
MNVFAVIWKKIKSDFSQDLEREMENKLSRTEILHGVANRIVFSNAYKIFYGILTILSVINLVHVFIIECPSGIFLYLECTINILLLLEVLLRIIAVGKNYFKYAANIIDIFVVIFCAVTLHSLISRNCTAGDEIENIFDAVLLALRNAVQFSRLYIMMKKERQVENNYLDIESFRDFDAD